MVILGRMTEDDVSFLGKEMIQLSVKISLVVPDEKLTLLCSVWTK